MPRGQALDHAIERAGWCAVGGAGTWFALDAALQRATLLGTSVTLVPSIDRRSVWCDAGGERHSFVEIDGRSGETGRSANFAAPIRLIGAVSGGLVVEVFDEQGWKAHLYDIDTGAFVDLQISHRALSVADNMLFWLDEDDSTLYTRHFSPGAPTSRSTVDGRRWHTPLEPSVSPDGTRAVLALELFPDLESDELDFEHALANGLTTRHTRVVLVDLVSGTSSVVAGEVENFATKAIWAPDGKWAFFGAPFEAKLFAIDTTTLALFEVAQDVVPLAVIANGTES